MQNISEYTLHESSAVLNVANVSVYYRKQHTLFGRKKFKVLTNISCQVNKGEILGVIGRNGAGKSTLLRVIAGIIHPDDGTVVAQKGTTIMLLGLQLGFVNDLSGRDNAILSSMLMGMTLRDARAKLDRIREIFSFTEFFEEPLATYSSGMRARLGFAVAYCADADVLLLDEILGVGDESFRHKSTEMMIQKIKSGNTVVLVSHNLDFISKVCDRVLLIDKGVITASGSPQVIIKEYLTELKRRGDI